VERLPKQPGSPDAFCPPIDYRFCVGGNELRGAEMRRLAGVSGMESVESIEERNLRVA
jgi:hypothetical protein